jgi:hypothetical protein
MTTKLKSGVEVRAELLADLKTLGREIEGEFDAASEQAARARKLDSDISKVSHALATMASEFSSDDLAAKGAALAQLCKDRAELDKKLYALGSRGQWLVSRLDDAVDKALKNLSDSLSAADKKA